jgi:hypothetical protein
MSNSRQTERPPTIPVCLWSLWLVTFMPVALARADFSFGCMLDSTSLVWEPGPHNLPVGRTSMRMSMTVYSSADGNPNHTGWDCATDFDSCQLMIDDTHPLPIPLILTWVSTCGTLQGCVDFTPTPEHPFPEDVLLLGSQAEWMTWTWDLQPAEGYEWPQLTYIVLAVVTAHNPDCPPGQVCPNIGSGAWYRLWQIHPEVPTTFGDEVSARYDCVPGTPDDWLILTRQYNEPPWRANPGVWLDAGDRIAVVATGNIRQIIDGNGCDGTVFDSGPDGNLALPSCFQGSLYVSDVPPLALLGAIRDPIAPGVPVLLDNGIDEGGQGLGGPGFVGSAFESIAPRSGWLQFRVNTLAGNAYTPCEEDHHFDLSVTATPLHMPETFGAVLAPAAGTTVQRGTTVSLLWEGTNAEGSWFQINSPWFPSLGWQITHPHSIQPVDDGLWTAEWDVPQDIPGAPEYVLRVVSADGEEMAQSGSFTIDPSSPALAVLSPQPPVTWPRATTQVVQWVPLSEPVRVRLLRDSPPSDIWTSGPTRSGEQTVVLPCTLETGSDYRVRVEYAFDPNLGVEIAPIEIAAELPPPAPSGESPPTGDENVQAGTVQLAWPTIPEATTYDVYFSTDSDPLLVATGLTVNHLAVTAPLEGTVYYWRVVARTCQTGTSGPVWWFETRVCSGGQWAAAASGVGWTIWALAEFQGNLWAAGNEGACLRWDGEIWQGGTVFTGGTPTRVCALAVYDDGTGPALYAAGSFSTADGIPANNVARWDGASWQPLGLGTGGVVHALAVYQAELYAGGYFDSAGEVAASRIARWNGASWAPVGTGTDGTICALNVFNGVLYVGGTFNRAGEVSYLAGLATWDGVVWSGSAWLLGGVYAFSELDGELYVGGDFSSAYGVPWNHVVRFNPTIGWQTLGDGTDGRVSALSAYNGQLCVGGYFSSAGGVPADHLARWNGNAWVTLCGTNSMVNALLAPGDRLWCGGEFTSVGGIAASHVAYWTADCLIPRVLNQPADAQVTAGQDTFFAVSVAGSEPLGFQWQKGGMDLVDDERISGAQSPTLVLQAVRHDDAGSYRVMVENACGNVTSAEAALTVLVLAGDCNGDGQVGAVDAAPLLACLTGPGFGVPESCACADLDADSDADLTDLAVFQNTVEGN